MLHPKMVYRREIIVGAYDLDANERLHIPALLRVMHEAAMQNVMDIDLSYWDLMPHRITWVLMRKSLEIHRNPKLGEKLILETFPSGFEKYFTYRDFIISDMQGNPVATASSSWLLMDTLERRMVSIPDFILEYEMPDRPFLPRPARKIPRLTSPCAQKAYPVGWFEVDWNGHLNNIQYVLRMLDALPLEVPQNKILRKMEITYRQEVKLGAPLESQVQMVEQGDGNVFLHQILPAEGGKPYALGRSHWE